MRIQILSGHPSEKINLREQALLDELSNDDLIKKLRYGAQRDGINIASRIIDPPDLLLQGNDSLGCVITCYRMAASAQGGEKIVSQTEARNILRQNAIVGGGQEEAELSPTAARLLGVQDTYNLGQLAALLHPKEKDYFKQVQWPTKIGFAIDTGYMVIGRFPMNILHEDWNSSIYHAILIYGAECSSEGKTYFLVRDPKNKVAKIAAEQLVKADRTYSDDWDRDASFLAIPSKNANPSSINRAVRTDDNTEKLVLETRRGIKQYINRF